jgi:hypothetical protein
MEANIVLGFLILAYFFLIIATYLSMVLVLSPFPLSRSEAPWEFLQFQSVWYLAIAPAVIPHAWYLYNIVKREMGSEALDPGVGLIAPMAISYVLFVLGPSLGLYPPAGSLIRSFFGFNLVTFPVLVPCIVLGPFYIIFFYLFPVRTKSGESKSPEEAKEQTSESKKESLQEESSDATSQKDTDTRKGSGIAFKLFVLGYGLLLGGILVSFLFLGNSSDYIPFYSVFVLLYIGVLLMVLSQAWYLFVGRYKSTWEGEELRNTLIKYIGVPAVIIFIVYFLVPAFVFPEFRFVYQPVIDSLNILVPVLLLAGPVYAALFYVYRIA